MTYSLTAEPIPPTWYALVVQRGGEEPARQILLRDDGIQWAFYPDETISWTNQGRHYTRKKAFVTGYVFCKFTHRPRFHIIRERRGIFGPLAIDGWPVPIQPVIIKHLQGLTVDFKELMEARRKARMVSEGDKARFAGDHPLADVVVNVTEVDGAMVRFLFPGGLSGETDMANLQKVAAE